MPQLTRSVLVIRSKPGCRERIVELFARLRVLERAREQAGFLGGELQVPVDDDDDHVLVTATWESPAAYRGWLENPVREEIGAELGDLTAEDPEPRVYTIVEAVVQPVSSRR